MVPLQTTDPVGRYLSGTWALLFIEQDCAGGPRAAFGDAPWPPGVATAVIDPRAEPELTKLLGVRKTPCVIILRNGCIASIEHECSAQACDRLLAEVIRRDQRAFVGLR